MVSNPDANHAEIRDTLRDLYGVWVFDCQAVGGGFPDLLTTSIYGCTVIGKRASEVQELLGDDVIVLPGYNLPMEIKSDKGKLRASQKKWHQRSRGPVVVVRLVEEALKWTGIMR